MDNDGVLTHDFDRRCEDIEKDNVLEGYAALCPEFELRQSYFNQLFTGTQFEVKMAKSQFSKKYFDRSGTHFYNLSYTTNDSTQDETYNIMAIGDNVKALRVRNNYLVLELEKQKKHGEFLTTTTLISLLMQGIY